MIDVETYSKIGDNYKYVQEEFNKLRELLQNFKSSENKAVKIFLQGSYKNDTNIGKESDIDIVVFYKHVFVSNIKNPNDMKVLNFKNTVSIDDTQRYNNCFINANYSATQFKSELISYLKLNSKYLISEGKKTIKCQIPNSTFVFDIVSAFEYRLYSNFVDSNTNYVEGNVIYDQFGNRIINFPKQSYNNSVTKNKNCDGKYKETVRIIKNIMKNEIIETNWIPLFALESLLYNVSNEYFIYNDKGFRCSKVIEQVKKIINTH